MKYGLGIFTWGILDSSVAQGQYRRVILDSSVTQGQHRPCIFTWVTLDSSMPQSQHEMRNYSLLYIDEGKYFKQDCNSWNLIQAGAPNINCKKTAVNERKADLITMFQWLV